MIRESATWAVMTLIAVAQFADTSATDDCGRCRSGKTCRAHLASDAEAIDELEEDLQSDDPTVRIRALRDVADLRDDHENAPSKAAAKVLAEALEDEKLSVRKVAVQLLVRDQHPEVAIDALVELYSTFRGDMLDLVPTLTGRKEEHGNGLEAMDYLRISMRAAENLPDDRVADALRAVLVAFPTEMHGQPVAMAASDALLSFGTIEAVEAVVRQFNSKPQPREASRIHNALERFADELDVEPAEKEEDDSYADVWGAWLKKHRRALPRKLGRFKGSWEHDEDHEGDDGKRHGSRSPAAQ